MEPISIGVFERPGADFVLRRALELVSDRRQASATLRHRSKFVLLLRVADGTASGVYVNALTEVFEFLAGYRRALGADAPDFVLELAVEPKTKVQIDEALADAAAMRRAH